MAAQYKHKRYFRRVDIGTDSTMVLHTFSSTADARTKLGFGSVWNTSSPTTTDALEDGNKTLVVTYEFASADAQTAFKNAIDSTSEMWNDSAYPHAYRPEHFKTEWLHEDGSVSNTTNTADSSGTDMNTYISPTFTG